VHRFLLVALFALLVVLAVSGAAAAQTTTTAPAEAGGTSPWVLVLIGAAAGALVGVFTGLARRRRARQGS